jgi:hypothetical protein
MGDWTRCPACGLAHSRRADGLCPRCHGAVSGAATGPAPSTGGTESGAGATSPSPVALPAATSAGVPARPVAGPSAPGVPAGAAVPGKRSARQSVGSIAGIAIGIGVSRFFGAALLVPSVVGVAAGAVLARWGPIRSRPFAAAGGVIIGHVAWMVAGALVLRSFSAVGIDIVLMSAGVAWLLAWPALAPVLVLAAFEVMGTVVNAIQLNSGETAGFEKALVLHLLLRIGALVALGVGYRAFRSQAQSAPAASVARVFD